MQETYPVGDTTPAHAACLVHSSLAEDEKMLFTIAVILLILWLLGFATHVVGSAIHVVLVIALVLFVLGLFTGRRTTI